MQLPDLCLQIKKTRGGAESLGAADARKVLLSIQDPYKVPIT